MRVYYIIFDKNIFKNTQSCREWIKNSSFSYYDKVIEFNEYYRYKVNKNKPNGRLKKANLGIGIAALVK
jgi:hypothetical protein